MITFNLKYNYQLIYTLKTAVKGINKICKLRKDSQECIRKLLNEGKN